VEISWTLNWILPSPTKRMVLRLCVLATRAAPRVAPTDQPMLPQRTWQSNVAFRGIWTSSRPKLAVPISETIASPSLKKVAQRGHCSSEESQHQLNLLSCLTNRASRLNDLAHEFILSDHLVQFIKARFHSLCKATMWCSRDMLRLIFRQSDLGHSWDELREE